MTTPGLKVLAKDAFTRHYSKHALDVNAATRTPPVVYSDQYNISFCSLERMHPFDSKKFEKVMRSLKKARLVNQPIEPREATDEVLMDVHEASYLRQLHSSPVKVAAVIELPIIAMLPMCLLQRFLLKKMRRHVCGTILAVGLAAHQGWAINIGGGMHHARYNDGEGWCPYSDITLAIRQVRRASAQAIQRIMIIDTDVHQGNGHERDKLHFCSGRDQDLFIVDIYNADIWPMDQEARTAIDVERCMHTGCHDAEYLLALQSALDEAFELVEPDLVIHNAGTDVLAGDPLGRMCLSPEAVVERDSMVWRRCRSSDIPVCMLLSGGYAKNSSTVIARSVCKLIASES